MRLPPKQLFQFQWNPKLQQFVLDTLCAPYESVPYSYPWNLGEDTDMAEFTTRCVATLLVTVDTIDKQRLLGVLSNLTSIVQLPQSKISPYALIARSLSDENICEALERLVRQREHLLPEFYELGLYKLRTLIKKHGAIPGLRNQIGGCMQRLCSGGYNDTRLLMTSETLENLMMLICECVFRDFPIPTRINLKNYLQLMEYEIPMRSFALSMHRAIGDQLVLHLRNAPSISGAECALTDVLQLTSWHKDLPRNSMVPVLVEDVLLALNRFGLNLHDLHPSRSFMLSYLAADVIFAAMGLSTDENDPKCLLSSASSRFADLLCLLDSQLVKHSYKGEWKGTYNPEGPSRDSLRINITQFLTLFCMPLYQEHQSSWNLGAEDLKKLATVKDINILLQLSLIKEMDVTLTIPDPEHPIWEDQSWHLSVFHWCISTGKAVRKGDFKSLASSLCFSLLSSPVMDYILDLSCSSTVLSDLLPIFFEAGKTTGFWRDFDTSGGLDWLEQFYNIDAYTTTFAIRILASIASSTKGRGRIQRCVRLLASFLSVDVGRGIKIRRQDLASLKKSEGFTKEARDLANLLQEMKMDRTINRSQQAGITSSILNFTSSSRSMISEASGRRQPRGSITPARKSPLGYERPQSTGNRRSRSRSTKPLGWDHSDQLRLPIDEAQPVIQIRQGSLSSCRRSRSRSRPRGPIIIHPAPSRSASTVSHQVTSGLRILSRRLRRKPVRRQSASPIRVRQGSPTVIIHPGATAGDGSQANIVNDAYSRSLSPRVLASRRSRSSRVIITDTRRSQSRSLSPKPVADRISQSPPHRRLQPQSRSRPRSIPSIAHSTSSRKGSSVPDPLIKQFGPRSIFSRRNDSPRVIIVAAGRSRSQSPRARHRSRSHSVIILDGYQSRSPRRLMLRRPRSPPVLIEAGRLSRSRSPRVPPPSPSPPIIIRGSRRSPLSSRHIARVRSRSPQSIIIRSRDRVRVGSPPIPVDSPVVQIVQPSCPLSASPPRRSHSRTRSRWEPEEYVRAPSRPRRRSPAFEPSQVGVPVSLSPRNWRYRSRSPVVGVSRRFQSRTPSPIIVGHSPERRRNRARKRRGYEEPLSSGIQSRSRSPIVVHPARPPRAPRSSSWINIPETSSPFIPMINTPQPVVARQSRRDPRGAIIPGYDHGYHGIRPMSPPRVIIPSVYATRDRFGPSVRTGVGRKRLRTWEVRARRGKAADTGPTPRTRAYESHSRSRSRSRPRRHSRSRSNSRVASRSPPSSTESQSQYWCREAGDREWEEFVDIMENVIKATQEYTDTHVNTPPQTS